MKVLSFGSREFSERLSNYRRRIFEVILCSVTATPAACWSAETVSEPSIAAQAETLVLRVTLNTEDKGDLFVARTGQQDFLIKIQDLKSIGLKEPAGNAIVLEGESYISLRSMPGVSFAFDERALALNIVAEPGLLPNQALKLQAERALRKITNTGSSAFFNYALDYARSDSIAGARVGLAGEVGIQKDNFLFLSDFNSLEGTDGKRKLIRLMSSVTHDDLEDLRRTVLGDFFTPSRDLSTGVSLGGLSVSKLYELNPFLVHSPTQTVSGTVALPSDLEVYLDGQRIRSEKIKPGGFELNDIMAYGGARSVRVLLRDSFGRVQEFTYSFYFSDQPLKQGLHEYSYNIGAMRRDYGAASNRYGPAAFTLFHRYGATDAVTLGLRAEGRRNFYNAGPLATLVLGPAGVVNLALAGSSVDGRRGAAASAAYNYLAQKWSAGLALRRDWGDYATLGDPPLISNRRYEGNAVASYNFSRYGAVTLSHSVRSNRAGTAAATQTLLGLAPVQNQSVTALSYGVPVVPGSVSLTVRLSHIRDTTIRNELSVGLIAFLSRNYSVSANFHGDQSAHREGIEITKNQPVGEGLGFVLIADRTTDLKTQSLQGRSNIQYNTASAILRGEYGRRQSSDSRANDYRLSAAGGVAYVGGRLGLGRPVTGSFGLVKVGELPDVAVSVNGQPLGKTDSKGTLFVPILNPYFDNDVSIAPESVPIDYSIPAMSKRVFPSLRGGVVIDFGVTKVQAFTGKLTYLDEGANKPVEFLEFNFSAQGKTITLQTGRAGEFYVENVKAGTYAATVVIAGRACRFDIIIPNSEETFVELGELVCRPPP